MQTAPCYVRRFDTIPACDRQTDGIAVASTALAMRTLQCIASIAVHSKNQLLISEQQTAQTIPMNGKTMMSGVILQIFPQKAAEFH